MTDKQKKYNELIVFRCQRGKKAAFEELIQRWERPLFYYIRRLVEDEQQSWQVLQETWLKVLQGIDRLREPHKLSAWLYSIARKTAMSYLRKKYSEQTLLMENNELHEMEATSENINFENAERVHYGLSRLSIYHREVLTLFFIEDLSVKDIAEVLEIPSGTVKSRLYHAKKALKTLLVKEVCRDE